MTPTERMRSVDARVPTVAEVDWELAELVVDLEPTRQRRLARWAARRASRYAGIETQPSIAHALQALDNDESLPEPFNNPADADSQLPPEPKPGAVSQARMVITTTRDRNAPIAPWAAAIDSILSAGKADPASAAVDALAGAPAGQADPASLLADVHRFLQTDA
jgi:hypothetical protein